MEGVRIVLHIDTNKIKQSDKFDSMRDCSDFIGFLSVVGFYYRTSGAIVIKIRKFIIFCVLGDGEIT